MSRVIHVLMFLFQKRFKKFALNISCRNYRFFVNNNFFAQRFYLKVAPLVRLEKSKGYDFREWHSKDSFSSRTIPSKRFEKLRTRLLKTGERGTKGRNKVILIEKMVFECARNTIEPEDGLSADEIMIQEASHYGVIFICHIKQENKVRLHTFWLTRFAF